MKNHDILGRIPEVIRNRRSFLMTLAVITVFITTYILILPAMTLDKNEAQKQGGIDVNTQTEEAKAGQSEESANGQANTEAAGSDENASANETDSRSGSAQNADAGDAAENDDNAQDAEEAQNSDQGSAEDASNDSSSGTLTAKGKGYSVSAMYDADAGLPENTELTTQEIGEKSKEYSTLRDLVLKAVRKKDGKSNSTLKFSKFYDISLTADGEEQEPAASVDVIISYDKALAVEQTSDVHIVHFIENEKTGKTEAEVLDQKDVDLTVKKKQMTEAAFEADSFSVYGIVYTVDFHYEAEGQTYDYSIPGGGFISLTDLVEKLNIAGETSAEEFVGDVENVEFSSPKLMSVSKAAEDTTVGAIKEALSLDCEYSADMTKEDIKKLDAAKVSAGDWALISLKPFNTEETLTVTMENGDRWKIRITDIQGSIISNGSALESGEYMIVYRSGSKYYAYSNYGNTDEVEYNPSTGKVSYNGERQFVWEVSPAGDNWPDHYLFNAKSRSDWYIGLEGSSILRQWWGAVKIQKGSQNNTFTMQGDSSGPGPYLGWNGSSFTAAGSPAEVFLVKVEEGPVHYTFNVTVDNASHGTVSGTKDDGTPTGAVTQFTVTTDEVGANAYGDYNAGSRPITATAKQGYVFDHWEVDGSFYTNEQTLNGTLSMASDNVTLKAIFKKDTSVNDEMSKDEIKEQLKTWSSEMLSDTIKTSKTAQVADYGNRTYEITMSASSGVRRVLPTIDLEFITDVSRSMYFPATLEEVTTFTQGTKASRYWANNRWNWDFFDTSLYDWLYNNGNQNTIYYTISDNSSATIDAVYYGGSRVNPGDDQEYNSWRYYDSSNVDPPDGQNHAGIRVPQRGAVEPWGNPLTGTLYTQVGSLVRMDYLQAAAEAASEVLYGLDPSARVGLVPFAADAYESNFYTKGGTDGHGKTFSQALNSVVLYGGTNQKKGLEKGIELFQNNERQNPSPKRVAILITDGAPNQEGCDWTTIPGAATQLKNLYGTDSVELYTIGLSMDLVGEENREGLKSIATGGADGDHWFEANNGAALVDAIKQIMTSIVNEASLKGDITDSIDPAFYPVAKDGTPLKAGDLIDLEGNRISSRPSDGKCGEISFDGSVYGVKWGDQNVAYSESGAPTWTGKIYVKAKEDFLGGNTIKTNGGTNDTFTPKKYVIDGEEYDLLPGDDTKLKRTFETPYVNVDELTLTQNSTEWTVYLGTDVTPSEQLDALAEEIRVKEVVSSSENHMITDKSAMLGSSKTDASETFPLKQVLDLDALSQEEWNSLISGETLTKPYSAYGHDAGTMVMSMVKAGTGADVGQHTTTVTGNAVERYLLSTVYVPAAVDTEVSYRTTPGGSPGAPTERMVSSNSHIINVFAKKLSILKVDQTKAAIRNASATFKLYRKAQNGETPLAAADVPKSLPSGSYVLADTLTIDADGKADTNIDISRLPNDEPYYLVETAAPAGYNMLTGALEVRPDIRDTWTKVLDKTEPKTSDTKWNPYILSNWDQNATILVSGQGEAAGCVIHEGNYVYDQNQTTSKVSYKIVNDAGVELPSAGGPGVIWMYILGSILLIGCGVILIARRRITER